MVSGDEKIKKPDYRIYEILLNRYSVNAKNSIFIDDALENIEAANDLGFQTIHFLSANQLQEELQKLSLI